KRFNDSHGHQAGDDALRGVARLARQSIGESGFVARYGGEAFAVSLAGMNRDVATACCERARPAIGAAPLRVGRDELRVTGSRRLAQWRRSGTPLTLLLVQVDAYPQVVSDHGPGCAEVVLRIAAQLINASMRDMDHLARLSEDTFALLLPGALLSDGMTIAQRLRQTVERCVLPRKAGTTWITISVGVV